MAAVRQIATRTCEQRAHQQTHECERCAHAAACAGGCVESGRGAGCAVGRERCVDRSDTGPIGNELDEIERLRLDHHPCPAKAALEEERVRLVDPVVAASFNEDGRMASRQSHEWQQQLNEELLFSAAV